MELVYPNRYVASGTDTDYPLSPEVELWTEVILQAIDDLDRRTRICSREDQRAAREWIDSDADYLGSFVWACHAINLDPDFIRSQLAKKHHVKHPGKVTMRSRPETGEKLTGSVTDVAEQPRSRSRRNEAA